MFPLRIKNDARIPINAEGVCNLQPGATPPDFVAAPVTNAEGVRETITTQGEAYVSITIKAVGAFDLETYW